MLVKRRHPMPGVCGRDLHRDVAVERHAEADRCQPFVEVVRNGHGHYPRIVSLEATRPKRRSMNGTLS